MTTLSTLDELVSVEDYLANEPLSEVKHEYVGGIVYAMSGASDAHNRVAMNLYTMLNVRLRGKSCEPFGSDIRLRFQVRGDSFFYYPDAMIVCDPTDGGNGWRERPSALFEIISADRRRVDEGEKRELYLQLPSLLYYVRIEQAQVAIAIDTRAGGWTVERRKGLDASLELPDLSLSLPLAELYERVFE